MKKGLLVILVFFQIATCQLFGETVVAIHGFLSNAKSMRPIKETLCRCDYNVCLWEYPSRRKYIEEHACRLVETLTALARNCPGEPISFVTHSIGALVLRAALNQPGCPREAKIGRAVLIAPPNQGSSLARDMKDVVPIAFIMGDKTGAELLHFTPAQIACRFGEFPPSVRVLVIAGTQGTSLFFNAPNDRFLRLDETYLNTPFYFISFPFSHGDLLERPESLCCMKQFFLN
jgi:pimeloyl-ACP methyl ester carboxylesterase